MFVFMMLMLMMTVMVMRTFYHCVIIMRGSTVVMVQQRDQ
jgi:hypothetical protein